MLSKFELFLRRNGFLIKRRIVKKYKIWKVWNKNLNLNKLLQKKNIFSDNER